MYLSPKYTFGQLCEDACKFYNLTFNDMILHDNDGTSWPLEANIYDMRRILTSNDASILLGLKKGVQRRPNRDRPSLFNMNKLTSDDLTEELSNRKNSQHSSEGGGGGSSSNLRASFYTSKEIEERSESNSNGVTSSSPNRESGKRSLLHKSESEFTSSYHEYLNDDERDEVNGYEGEVEGEVVQEEEGEEDHEGELYSIFTFYCVHGSIGDLESLTAQGW